MTDQPPAASPPTATQAPQAGQVPLTVKAQYIKDLSFENPRAPHSLMQQKEPPEVQLGVDVKAQALGQDVYEVVLTISANASSAGEAVFVAELAYAAVVTVRNTPQTMLPNVLLVETPRLLFPFARGVIATATREGGFPPLLLHPVDFAELLRRQQAAGQTTGPIATA